MSRMVRLVLGTRNQKKLEELASLLAPLNIELRSLADYPQAIEVEEDGDSFAANAEKKAVQQAQHLQEWVLGEDSGLRVDALQGAPGVHSARYAGPNASDDDNNQKLLAALSDTPLEKRTAHYVCHAVLADPEGRVRARVERYCHGRIRSEPAGSNGFGYDPLFEIIEYHRTFGELGPHVKSVISHRARALRALAWEIEQILAADQWTASSVG